MTKVLIVPDVHGRTFWKKAMDYDGKIVFLGDYLDPYPWYFDPDGSITEYLNGEQVKLSMDPRNHDELITDAIANFREIVGFAAANPSRVVLLKGNHDHHYSADISPECSRYERRRADEIKSIFDQNASLFSFYHQDGHVLFTHAGLSKEWMESEFSEPLDFRQAFAEATDKQLWQASGYRGGWAKTSGPLWLDYHEVEKSKATLYTDSQISLQIFGHTLLAAEGATVNVPNGICIDSRALFVVDTDQPEDGMKRW